MIVDKIYDYLVKPLRKKILVGMDLEHELEEDSYLARYNGSIEFFEQHLVSMGFVRNPFSWLKTGEYGLEEASWVKRSSLFSHRQLHVTLQYHDGDTWIYVHEEPNTFRHPIKHIRANDVNIRKGKNMMKEQLDGNVDKQRVYY